MSSGEGDRADQAALRALAHPLRLEIMSLLSDAAMTAADVARRLGISHANASYHLRNLLSGGQITVAAEEKIRGGVAKRYQHGTTTPIGSPEAAGEPGGAHRRPVGTAGPGFGLLGDTEIWVDPEAWPEIRDRLRAAARPPHTPGTVRVVTAAPLAEQGEPE